jgi:hypothetical protein
MVSKWSRDERRRRKAEQAAAISEFDREALDLMREVRRHVGGAQYSEHPRGMASFALQTSIEKWAEVVTGDAEYFWQVRNGEG